MKVNGTISVVGVRCLFPIFRIIACSRLQAQLKPTMNNNNTLLTKRIRRRVKHDKATRCRRKKKEKKNKKKRTLCLLAGFLLVALPTTLFVLLSCFAKRLIIEVKDVPYCRSACLSA